MKLKCDKINVGKIRFELFESAINVGNKRATRFLQIALNEECYVDDEGELKIDGHFGNTTFKTLKMYEEVYGKEIAFVQNREQSNYYSNLIRRVPKLKVYYRGWRKRTF